MISRLRGQLIQKKPPSVLIEVAGVGYQVECPMSTVYKLPELEQECILLTHLAIRDDAHILYGFNTDIERDLFRALLKVNGVGAKMALAVLSSMSPSQFVQCITAADGTTLVRIPGVGKKTAERLIIEMKDRVEALNVQNTDLSASNHNKVDNFTLEMPHNPVTEAIEALQALGYKPMVATKMVRQVSKPDMTSETLIRLALKSMNS